MKASLNASFEKSILYKHATLVTYFAYSPRDMFGMSRSITVSSAAQASFPALRRLSGGFQRRGKSALRVCFGGTTSEPAADACNGNTYNCVADVNAQIDFFPSSGSDAFLMNVALDWRETL